MLPHGNGNAEVPERLLPWGGEDIEGGRRRRGIDELAVQYEELD